MDTKNLADGLGRALDVIERRQGSERDLLDAAAALSELAELAITVAFQVGDGGGFRASAARGSHLNPADNRAMIEHVRQGLESGAIVEMARSRTPEGTGTVPARDIPLEDAGRAHSYAGPESGPRGETVTVGPNAPGDIPMPPIPPGVLPGWVGQWLPVAIWAIQNMRAIIDMFKNIRKDAV